MANPYKLTMDQERIAFYYAIGLALTQWSHIECSLYGVASACFSYNPVLAGAFFSIENFRSKIAFVNRAFEASIYQSKHEPEFRSLITRVETLTKYRNKIAHARVIGYPQFTAGQRWAVVPLFSDNPGDDWIEKPPKNAIFLTHIDAAARRFAKASIDIFHFHSAITEKLSVGESHSQDMPHLSPDQLVAQIQSMLTPPGKETER